LRGGSDAAPHFPYDGYAGDHRRKAVVSGNMEDRVLVLEAAFKALAARLHKNKAVDLNAVADDLHEEALAMANKHGPSSKQALQAFSLECLIDGLLNRARSSEG
jgi:hypothetical protein